MLCTSSDSACGTTARGSIGPRVESPELRHSWDRLRALLPAAELTGDHEQLVPQDWADDPAQNACLEDIAQGLFRSKQGHILLVGPNGVGKTSLLYRLALRIQQGDFTFLREMRVVSIDVSDVDPDDSRSCLELIFLAAGELGRVILCLDGMGALVRRSHGRNNNPLLRTLLAQPHVKVIGTMNDWEYAELIGCDSRMALLFTRLDVAEPEGMNLQHIVERAAQQLSGTHQLAISPDVVERTIALTSVFLLSESQPAKSIDVLRLACEDLSFERSERGLAHSTLTIADVVEVLARKTGVPIETINGQGHVCDFEKALEDVVVGQSVAVREVATELQLISAGLVEEHKPASVMMFAGMTGVGKTELAKRVAELYSSSRRLQVYSMGNFTESHSVSGIIGVPPGYVGHEDGGRLINELRADPYGVFLLDEAEKCHPNVWKPFLNLFDEGWICDQRGVKAYADRAIFILTTNAGDRNISHLVKSGKPSDEVAQQVKLALSRVRHERSSQPVFPPQFLSRIKRIIVFNPLDQAAMQGITQCVAKRLSRRWKANRNKQLVLAPKLIERIARVACERNEQSNGQEGGRIVQKLISDHVETAVYKKFLERRDAYEECQQIMVSLVEASTAQDSLIPVDVTFDLLDA